MFKRLAITVGILLGMLFVINPACAAPEDNETVGLALGDVDIYSISFEALDEVESKTEHKLTLTEKIKIGLALLRTDEGKEAVKQHLWDNRYAYVGCAAMVCIGLALGYLHGYCESAISSGKNGG
jgi:hypothetical protein